MSFEFPEMPKYEYQGADHTSSVYDKEIDKWFDNNGLSNPYMMIYGVDEDSFLEGFLKTEHDLVRKPWKSYDHDKGTVLLEMECEVHGTACGSLNNSISIWAREMSDMLLSVSAPYRGEHRTKRPDIAFRPQSRRAPNGRKRKWPSIVIEVRWTESERHLKDDLDFWLKDTDGEVQVVLSLTIFTDYRITIERWSVDDQCRLVITDQVEIRRTVDKLPYGFTLSGELTVDFHDIFLRPRLRGETDLSLSRDFLQHIVVPTWSSQWEQLEGPRCKYGSV